VYDAGAIRKLPQRERPLMLVMVERFTNFHSIFRTHSRTLLHAREHFETVAICDPRCIDADGRKIFDRTLDLKDPDDLIRCVKQIHEIARSERPDVAYMPSIGMWPWTIFASNLRLAPLQICGSGHPATTYSAQIDYFSVESDFVGAPSCFSERLLQLPKDGQPYMPSARLANLPVRSSRNTGHLQIGIAASLMKLSATFLTACKEIAARSGLPVHFHFLTTASTVFSLMHLDRVLSRILPSGSYTVHEHQSYMKYVSRLNEMDMFLSPFPFGNTNGIVDAFTVGLPGVCKTGPEVFEHIDEALFARASVPDWLVADSVENYIAAAVRLVTNHEEREALRARMLETRVVERFFEGRPQAFGEMVLETLRAQNPE
jgi:glycosyltransferase involved in cell wall biosynthesis